MQFFRLVFEGQRERYFRISQTFHRFSQKIQTIPDCLLNIFEDHPLLNIQNNFRNCMANITCISVPVLTWGFLVFPRLGKFLKTCRMDNFRTKNFIQNRMFVSHTYIDTSTFNFLFSENFNLFSKLFWIEEVDWS